MCATSKIMGIRRNFRTLAVDVGIGNMTIHRQHEVVRQERHPVADAEVAGMAQAGIVVFEIGARYLEIEVELRTRAARSEIAAVPRVSIPAGLYLECRRPPTVVVDVLLHL